MRGGDASGCHAPTTSPAHASGAWPGAHGVARRAPRGLGRAARCCERAHSPPPRLHRGGRALRACASARARRVHFTLGRAHSAADAPLRAADAAIGALLGRLQARQRRALAALQPLLCLGTWGERVRPGSGGVGAVGVRGRAVRRGGPERGGGGGGGRGRPLPPKGASRHRPLPTVTTRPPCQAPRCSHPWRRAPRPWRPPWPCGIAWCVCVWVGVGCGCGAGAAACKGASEDKEKTGP